MMSLVFFRLVYFLFSTTMSRSFVEKLHLDILRLIFSMVLPTTLQPVRRNQTEMLVAIVLSSVCRHWRAVALDFAYLWSILRISFEFDATLISHPRGVQDIVYCLDRARFMLHLWRDRSKGILLQAFIDVDTGGVADWKILHERPEYKFPGTFLFEGIKAQRHRLTAMHWISPSDWLFHLRPSDFLNPHLESLHIAARHRNAYEGSSWSIHTPASLSVLHVDLKGQKHISLSFRPSPSEPSLTHSSLVAINFICRSLHFQSVASIPSFPHLSRLYIDACHSATDVYNVMRSSPLLEELKLFFHTTRSYVIPQAFPDGHVTLNYLKWFMIQSTGRSDEEKVKVYERNLLTSINAPGLHTFVYIRNARPVDYPLLAEFLQRSSQLQRLHLFLAPDSGEMIGSIRDVLPFLTKLKILQCNVVDDTEDLFKALTVDNAVQNHCLSLEVFTCCCPLFDRDLPSFLNFVKSRVALNGEVSLRLLLCSETHL